MKVNTIYRHKLITKYIVYTYDNNEFIKSKYDNSIGISSFIYV